MDPGEEVTIVQSGPLRYYATCEASGANTTLMVFLHSTEPGSKYGPNLELSTTPLLIRDIVLLSVPFFKNSLSRQYASAMSLSGDFIGLEPDIIGLGVNIGGQNCVVAGVSYSG